MAAVAAAAMSVVAVEMVQGVNLTVMVHGGRRISSEGKIDHGIVFLAVFHGNGLFLFSFPVFFKLMYLCIRQLSF